MRCQLTTCRPGDTVLDVGANIGIFSLWASERVGPSGRVVAVEPLPPIFDALVHNVAAHEEWCRRTGAPGSRGTQTMGSQHAVLPCCSQRKVLHCSLHQGLKPFPGDAGTMAARIMPVLSGISGGAAREADFYYYPRAAGKALQKHALSMWYGSTLC